MRRRRPPNRWSGQPVSPAPRRRAGGRWHRSVRAGLPHTARRRSSPRAFGVPLPRPVGAQRDDGPVEVDQPERRREGHPRAARNHRPISAVQSQRGSRAVTPRRRHLRPRTRDARTRPPLGPRSDNFADGPAGFATRRERQGNGAGGRENGSVASRERPKGRLVSARGQRELASTTSPFCSRAPAEGERSRGDDCRGANPRPLQPRV